MRAFLFLLFVFLLPFRYCLLYILLLFYVFGLLKGTVFFCWFIRFEVPQLNSQANYLQVFFFLTEFYRCRVTAGSVSIL